MDEMSMLQLRIIALETAIEKLNKIIDEFQSAHTGLERLGALEARIKVLEEARQRQIIFNTEVSNRLTRMEKPAEKVIKFWPWK